MLARSRRFYRSHIDDPDTEWTRHRLQVALCLVALVTAALVGGGVWSLTSMISGSPQGAPASEGGDHQKAQAGRGTTTPQQLRHDLAARALPRAPEEAAQPGALSTARGDALEVPAPTSIGHAGVASGFPHTPEGALGQLAAIDTAALGSASVSVAQDVIDGWAMPGGPTSETWSGVEGLAALLGSAGMSADARDSIQLSVEPTMGFIKGTVGDDFVVPCIDMVITATAGSSAQPQQVAVSDCQRMTWTGDRWLVDAGPEPAPAPSLWPGTQASLDAGYRWLEVPQT